MELRQLFRHARLLFLVAPVLLCAALLLPACDSDNGFEEAGEEIDEGLDEMGDDLEDAVDD